MGLGDVIGKAVDAVTGNSSGTTLEDFLTKFTPSGGSYVNTIDPLHTFEVSFTFHPPANLASAAESSLGDVLKQAGAAAVNNLANNMTGGIAGAMANAAKKGIMDSHASFSPGKDTFMKYLAEASLLLNADSVISMGSSGSGGNSGTSPVTLNLGFYIQNVTLPMIKMEDGAVAETMLGKFPTSGRYVNADNNVLVMNVINTKLPLIEMIFYPWMREVTLPYWSYETAPYTTATIKVDMSKHTDIQYVFYGCRPCQLQAMTPTQEPDTTITRDVSFAFDFMFIQSANMKTSESVLDKVLGTASSLAGAAGNMMNL